MFSAMCGDGANDCGALKAAHTGISLSEAESSVASPFTSKTPNITCVLKVIKEGRAALVTSFGIFKYMASYSLCQFISVMILYSIDSNLTDIEFLYIDLFIISIFAFFFGRTKAYSGKLVKETPLNSLISVSPILSLMFQLIFIIFFQVLSFEHLKMQNWYEPFNITGKDDKDSVACVENYAIFTVSSFQYIILAVVFSKGPPYRQSIFSNYGIIFASLFLTAFSIYMALDPAAFLVDQFELVLPPDFNFRYYLLAYAFLNFVASILTEYFVIELLVFKKLRYKFHNVYKSKRKYLAIEKDLNKNSKWPTLTSSFPSAASPLTPLPKCTAEIVVETDKSFDKTHVLHTLFDSAPATERKQSSLSIKSSQNGNFIVNIDDQSPEFSGSQMNGITNDAKLPRMLENSTEMSRVSPVFSCRNGISNDTSPVFSGKSDPSFSLEEGFDFSNPSPAIFSPNTSSPAYSFCNGSPFTIDSSSEISPVFSGIAIAPRARIESLSTDDCIKSSPNTISSFNACGQSPPINITDIKMNSALELNNFENR